MLTDLELLEEIAADGGRLRLIRNRGEDRKDFAFKLMLIRRMQARGLTDILHEIPDYRNANLNETVLIQVEILDAGRRVLSQRLS